MNFNADQIYIGLLYDVGDGFIDEAFTMDLIYIKDEIDDIEHPEYMDYFYIDHNPDVFVRLK